MHIVHQGMGRRIAFGPAAGVAGPEPNGVVRAKTNWFGQGWGESRNAFDFLENRGVWQWGFRQGYRSLPSDHFQLRWLGPRGRRGGAVCRASVESVAIMEDTGYRAVMAVTGAISWNAVWGRHCTNCRRSARSWIARLEACTMRTPMVR
jgi:hypothetical protein